MENINNSRDIIMLFKDNDEIEILQAGDLDSCSLGFRVIEGGEKWENIGNGVYKRTISNYKIVRGSEVELK